ncbi:hypothetical protein ACTVCO_04700 [Sanguibacter sp. A247]|uniref:hypothetical protein n=1 Tax=unclassified Sanguibacter TaxID=2645534 RepID=UPI003FD8B57B
MARWVRGIVVVVCVLVVAVAVPTAPVARWVHGAIDDTDAYVEYVAPLARDPLVQERLADEVATRLLEQVDAGRAVRDAVTSVLGPLASVPGVADLVDDAVAAGGERLRDGVVAAARHAVGTAAFATAWDAAQRAAHTGVRWTLTSPDVSDAHRPAVGVDPDGTVVLDLRTLSDAVVAELDDLRLPVPDALRDAPALAGVVERLDALRMPVPDALRDLDVRVPVVTSVSLDRARESLGVVGLWGRLAPWAAVVGLVGAVLAARRRWLVLAACGGAVLVVTLGLVAGARVVAGEAVTWLALPGDGVLALVTDRVAAMLADGLPGLLMAGGLAAAAAVVVALVGAVLTKTRHFSREEGLR